jgi:polyhydroxyalkanoate synthase
LFLNLVAREVGGDSARRARILAAVERYQNAAPCAAQTPLPDVAATSGSTRLLYLAGRGVPLVLIPSLVNPPDVLDMPGQSFARFLAKGFAVHIIDWGRPDPAMSQLSLAGLVEERLAPLLRTLERPVLAGYCLGGALAIAAARLVYARALLTLAATWDLHAYPSEQRAQLAALWSQVKTISAATGTVSMDMIQPAFWALDPALPVRKYERYAGMPPGSAQALRFERLEDWANGGHPLPFRAAQDLFERGFAGNMLARDWVVGGERVDPAAISCPWLDIRASDDRIVPAAAAPPAPERRTVPLGHVGMIVGSRAEQEVWTLVREWLQTQTRINSSF